MGGDWGPCTRESALAPRPGATVWSALIRYDQKEPGSLSPSSRESHATEPCSAERDPSHSASSVDLPNPAGAEMSVSFDSTP